MSSWLGWTLGIIIFLIMVTISVALHELGHLVVAKKLNITVPKYFVGFGPTLWSKKRNGTEYGVKLLPFGGFIQIEDTSQPEKSPERSMLSYVSPWRRILVFLAGPLVNLVIGVVMLFVMLLAVPITQPSTTIKAVNACGDPAITCVASEAGFKAGDKIISLDGAPISSFGQMRGKYKQEGSTVVVERDGAQIPLTVKADKDGMIGITLLKENYRRGPKEAISEIGTLFYMNIQAIGDMPAQVPHLVKAIMGKEKRAPDSVSSIVGVGKAYGDTAASSSTTSEDKAITILMYTALLNLGLGFANLLPLLPLDGGRIMVAFMDWVKLAFAKVFKKDYRPVNFQIVVGLTAACGAMLTCLMVLFVIADIVAPVVV